MQKPRTRSFMETGRVVYLPIGAVRPNPSQPRKIFDQQGLQELAASIVQYGILQPLSVRRRQDGYELVAEVSKVVDVNEGTIYPLLKRLTNEHYFETYLRESTEGPPRKYYHLTAAGVLYRDTLEAEWDLFQQQVNRFLKEQRA